MRAKSIKWTAVAALFAIISCGGFDTFTVRESSTTTIPQGTALEQLAGDAGFQSLVGFDMSQNATIQNQGVERHEIDSVHLRSLRLTITDPPSGGDFTFLDAIEFYVSADGMERKLIAAGGPFDAGVPSVLLDVKNVDLAEYVAAPSMDITADVTGRRPQEDTSVQADLSLLVDVNVDGALCQ
jgi:hypothetical protein